jgi:hypothetical protein
MSPIIPQFFSRLVDAQSSFDGIDCGAIQNNVDGSWTVLQRSYFLPVWLNAGVTFSPGQLYIGNGMVGKLNQASGRASSLPRQPAPPAGN